MRDAVRATSEPADDQDRDDLVPLLDLELSRLPQRYRAALVTCELEGKSRREAAALLGIPEGTLSTHLARGRALLRDRLVRRGVTLGAASLSLGALRAEAAIAEPIVGQTVQAALEFAARSSSAGAAGAAALAQRVLKIMMLARLNLVLTSAATVGGGVLVAVVLGLTVLAGEPPKPASDAFRPGARDLAGRVIDRTGAGIAGADVWAIGGPWGAPETVARATADAQGRFVLTGVWRPGARDRAEPDRVSVFARGRDGRAGWKSQVYRERNDGGSVEIELQRAGDVRGRVIDPEGKPLADATVAVRSIGRRSDPGWSDFIALTDDVAGVYRGTTAADGSFVLRHLPQGASLEATVASNGFVSPSFSWVTTQPVSLVLDRRVGNIQGRLKLPAGRVLDIAVSVRAESTGPGKDAKPGVVSADSHATAAVGKDGSFRFEGLPPGRYHVEVVRDASAPYVGVPVEDIVVAPNAQARLELPLLRLATITGRVVDARTGRGVAGVMVRSHRVEKSGYAHDQRNATTDAEGRYAVAAQPGTIVIQPASLPAGYLSPHHNDLPIREIQGDDVWSDMKLTPATVLDGIVTDPAGRAVATAEVSFLEADRPGMRWRSKPITVKPDGTFHIDQLDPDDVVSLWARSGDATTERTVVVKPGEIQGKLSLIIDRAFAAQIRGTVVGGNGQGVEGANLTLSCLRPYAATSPKKGMAVGTQLADARTGKDGRFEFAGLWPDLIYDLEIETRGYGTAQVPRMVLKPGTPRDVGRIVLKSSGGRLAGRVIGSDRRPIAGAEVFNRGDGTDLVAATTDEQGRFELEGLLAGPKYAFARKEGYRFTGVKSLDDNAGLEIVLLARDEPPPEWKPVKPVGFAAQRDLARRLLNSLWQKYGARANDTNNGVFVCALQMAPIDLELALDWSAQMGHRYDDRVRMMAAEALADIDPAEALALLRAMPGRMGANAALRLAERFAETDPKKTLPFAEEAARHARELVGPERFLAAAQAGALLRTLGQDRAGRVLIDEAAGPASALGVDGRAGYERSLIAQALAPVDLDRAVALVEPITGPRIARDRAFAMLAAAMARIDSKQAVALAYRSGGNGFSHETALTEIAYRIGAERPDEAVAIIEGMKREPAERWQAEAFGWLAVALAPRDRARACALIDRGLDMMLDQRDWAQRSLSSGGEFASAVHVAACAERIGYPDMESVIMRVMAARQSLSQRGGQDMRSLTRALTISAVSLALLDPDAARSVLEQVDERCSIDPLDVGNARQQWLTAWALVDLKKAATLFDVVLANIDNGKALDLQRTEIFRVIEILTTPPHRRADVLIDRGFGSAWRPGYAH